MIDPRLDFMAKEEATKKEDAKTEPEKKKKKGKKTIVELEAEMRAEEEKRLREMDLKRPKGELKHKL